MSAFNLQPHVRKWAMSLKNFAFSLLEAWLHARLVKPSIPASAPSGIQIRLDPDTS